MSVPQNVIDAANSLCSLIKYDKQMLSEWSIVSDHFFQDTETEEPERDDELKLLLENLDETTDNKYFYYLVTSGKGWGVIQLPQDSNDNYLSVAIDKTKEEAIEWVRQKANPPTLQERIKEYLEGHYKSIGESDKLLKELLKNIEEKASAKETQD